VWHRVDIQGEGEGNREGRREIGRREKGEGRREKGEGRREKGEGRREKGEGRREKGEGRREKGDWERSARSMPVTAPVSQGVNRSLDDVRATFWPD
jgi:hypothetical protein